MAKPSWTQPVCVDCWNFRNPDRATLGLGEGELEKCCNCGVGTTSGIYVRIDPALVRHPATEDDDG